MRMQYARNRDTNREQTCGHVRRRGGRDEPGDYV